MAYPEFSEAGEVICQECGKGLKQLTATHLKTHNITSARYMEKYPGFPMHGKSRAKSKFTKIDMFEPKEPAVRPETESEKAMEDLITDDENVPSVEEIHAKVEEIEETGFEDEDLTDHGATTKIDPKLEGYLLDPTGQTPKDKVDILRYLNEVFPGIQNNYLITKLRIDGNFEYELITDIADPRRKLDFEFPNAFWHNQDAYHVSSRDDKLKRDGWKIYTINSRIPKIADVRKALGY